MPPLGPPRQDLTLAGTPILLELIAGAAGAEIAAHVVVAQVLAPRRGILLNRVELQGTFVQVWKRFQKEGFNPTEAGWGAGEGPLEVLVSVRSLIRGLRTRLSQATWNSGPL